MAIVNNLATIVRDNMTTYALWLSVGTTTSESISIASTTINGVVTTVARESISYPSAKKFTSEFLVPSGSANGFVFKRIAVKDSSTTSDIISISNIPDVDKNNLIEVAFEVTFEVINQ